MTNNSGVPVERDLISDSLCLIFLCDGGEYFQDPHYELFKIHEL
jgi:hypothetical protein